MSNSYSANVTFLRVVLQRGTLLVLNLKHHFRLNGAFIRSTREEMSLLARIAR